MKKAPDSYLHCLMYVGLKVMFQIAVETIHQYVYVHSHVFAKKIAICDETQGIGTPNFFQKLLCLVKRI